MPPMDGTKKRGNDGTAALDKYKIPYAMNKLLPITCPLDRGGTSSRKAFDQKTAILPIVKANTARNRNCNVVGTSANVDVRINERIHRVGRYFLCDSIPYKTLIFG